MTTNHYGQDREFLARHTAIVELTDGADSRVIVAPEWQARVMTSSLSGDAGASFGWLNRPFISARRKNPKFNNYGGEDRFWLGPEAGQFGLWFRPGDKFTFDDFRTPAGFNSGSFEVEAASSREITLRRQFEVTNYSGTRFACAVRRSVRLLDADAAALEFAAPMAGGLQWVGYETVNALTNVGASPWRKETGLPCIWILGMFNPLPRGRVIAPFVPGDEARLGPKISPYFRDIPPDRLQVGEDFAVFACDGAYRSKIGISPRRARNIIGSWDPDGRMLTVVTFNLPAAAHRLPYVNSQWEIQTNPYGGDVVNSYNDGLDPVTGTLLGPFYELETSSPGAELAPGETVVHAHRTLHATGSASCLYSFALKTLGVAIGSIIL